MQKNPQNQVTHIHGNALEVLPTLAESSLDSCVTDPPYELGFMNRKWDSTGIAYQVKLWKEVYRVLKPGAYLLAFGGDRTHHRLMCAIEDAGFELRTTITWTFAQGFPKSLKLAKYSKSDLFTYWLITQAMLRIGLVVLIPDELLTFSELALDWSGWGTALKPACEFIVMARKQLSEPNVSANVLRWGTGGINIDACRLPTKAEKWARPRGGIFSSSDGLHKSIKSEINAKGRWPSNVIYSHSPECNGECVDGCPILELDRQSGELKGGIAINQNRGLRKPSLINYANHNNLDTGFGDSGGASRFFHIAEWEAEDFLIPFYYCAKASRSERDRHLEQEETLTMNRVNPGGLEHDPRWGPIQVKNNHPTVKPKALMRYLCRLVTPSGGIVLDPFMGSGTTGAAATLEEFGFTGIEIDGDFCRIAEQRIKGKLLPLFEQLS